MADQPTGAEIAKTNTKEFTLFLQGDAVKKKIDQVVGGKEGTQFIASIVAAVSTNPGLAECENATLLTAALLGASLKLHPSAQLGQFYIVPFKDKKNKRTVATFVLGYKGYIQLAIRSGYYKKINVTAIKKGELQSFDPLNEEITAILIEDFDARQAAETIGYYASFEYINGFKKAIYWSKAQMLAHADKYSPAFSRTGYDKYIAGQIDKDDLWKYSSFWYKIFDDMAYKTMLRQIISKWGIMSVEMVTAFENDDRESYNNDKNVEEKIRNEANKTPIDAQFTEDGVDPDTGEVLETETEAPKTELF